MAAPASQHPKPDGSASRLPRGSKKPPMLVFVLIALWVAIILVVSALIWYMAQLQPQDECRCLGDPCAPMTLVPMHMGGTSPDNHTVDLTVMNVQCPFIASFASFEASIYMNGTSLGAPRTIVVNTTISFGTEAKLIVIDKDSNGKLTVGDRFLIYGMGEPLHWNFLLIWVVDGSQIWSMSWDTP